MPLLSLLLAPVALADGTCSTWSAFHGGRVEEQALTEISGVAAGRASRALWAHNDRGGEAVLYALDDDGGALGRVTVTGATNEDWEDVAAAPCDAACGCLYVGDIGDNDGTRDEGVVWRVPEPLPSDSETEPAEALRFVYPDGPHDAEALMVDPNTGEVFVVTKDLALTRVYAFPDVPPQPTAEPVTLEAVTTVDLGGVAPNHDVTAADVSPGGGRVVLRTNADVVLFTAPEGGGVREALATAYEVLPAPELDDGEAAAFSTDGRRIFLLQEGESSDVWELRCLGFSSDGEDASCVEDTDAPPDEGCGCGGSGSEGLLPLLALLGRRQPRRGRRR